MKTRIWYKQLDVYDCIRRLLILLDRGSSPIHLERLQILDFYLSTPSLLHKTKMRKEIRAKFRTLKILKPEKEFVALPAARLLFHQMGHVQGQAIGALLGKNLASIDNRSTPAASLTEIGSRLFKSEFSQLNSEYEMAIAEFLIDDFSGSMSDGLQELRSSTGLRRAAH